jgi:hypothetical protein
MMSPGKQQGKPKQHERDELSAAVTCRSSWLPFRRALAAGGSCGLHVQPELIRS